MPLNRTDSIEPYERQSVNRKEREEKMKHIKTMSQVIAEYRERGNKAYYKAMIAVHDEVEAELVHSSKAIVDRKKVTLKELRYAVDILECMAERG